MRLWLLAIVLAGCAGNLRVDPYAPKTGGIVYPGAVPDVRCAGKPETGPERGFRTRRHQLMMRFAHSDHRGFDLIASPDDPHILSGKLAYGIADKKLGREDVELFACLGGRWQPLGATRTDRNGKFALRLEGAAKLPIGLRDIYASVVADRSGVRFLAFVAPSTTKLIVTDIDGTLTASESSFIKAIVAGSKVKPHPGAAESLGAVAARGYQVVYVTARPDRFLDATRAWLGNNGFPRGPVRLADATLLLPGNATIAYKSRVFNELEKSFDIAAGVGNRQSDVKAYSAAGVPADRIFVKLPEYSGELGRALGAGAAVGFGAYGPLAVD